MTNLETIIAVLAGHREARQWSDDAVAADLVTKLGLDAAAIMPEATVGIQDVAGLVANLQQANTKARADAEEPKAASSR